MILPAGRDLLLVSPIIVHHIDKRAIGRVWRGVRKGDLTPKSSGAGRGRAVGTGDHQAEVFPAGDPENCSVRQRSTGVHRDGHRTVRVITGAQESSNIEFAPREEPAV